MYHQQSQLIKLSLVLHARLGYETFNAFVY